MKAEGNRKILVTIGEDHRLNIYDLEEKKLAGRIKIKNANLRALCINEDLKRVYVSSQEC